MSKEVGCKIVFDHFGVVAKWVCEGLKIDDKWLGENITLGFVVDGELFGGLIFNNYRENADVWWTIYTINRRWCNRRVLKCIFGVAFDFLNCRRISLFVSKSNLDCLRLIEKLGFKKEGLLREYRENGEDCFVLGMLKKECKWRGINEKCR